MFPRSPNRHEEGPSPSSGVAGNLLLSCRDEGTGLGYSGDTETADTQWLSSEWLSSVCRGEEEGIGGGVALRT